MKTYWPLKKKADRQQQLYFFANTNHHYGCDDIIKCVYKRQLATAFYLLPHIIIGNPFFCVVLSI